MTDLSASVQRELPEIIEHAVTVDCRGTGDMGGVTRAIAAAEAQRTGLTPIEAVCEWWKRSSRDAPLLVHFENPQAINGTTMADIVHVLRLLLSVHSIKTFLSTWPITDFSVIDLHVLSGGRLRKGTSSFENVLRATRKTALQFGGDFDERIGLEEEVVGGGVFAILKTMKTQNPAPRLSTLYALSFPSVFLSGTSDAAWDTSLSEQMRSQVTRQPVTGDIASDAFPELQALFNLWQASGKSVNLWDWLDSFRQVVVPSGVEDGGEHQPHAIDDDIDSRLHALFIRFVEEARLFGTVRARGKNTAKRGDEVVKGVVMP
ncbi:hypothetical protein A1Q2_05503 [Trichosporon asahii var. asahii CBS 8904]|uniref:Origin recognition complex subunit 3 winged helix C-terminal domain-containing protein n=1 Tax=Trichosporon asahii var. asahii (strain CBS 8904) TaxID=1220162 RepID=K1V895_TRIAC|nr:hypothetical protein A1Q2_05503 [Trichosporon asahii var. asahii CBS 8904]